MPTITLTQPGSLSLTDSLPPSAPASGHALVRIHRVGICGTDYHAFRGNQPFFTYPRVPGHELGVEVVEVNPADHALRPGTRCSVEPYLNCGACIACKRERPNCCANLKVLGVHTDGGMRDYLQVPLNKLHPSSKLTYDQLALVETLGIGAHAVARAKPTPGEQALVIGAGPIGLSVVQFLTLSPGVTTTVLDLSAGRLAAARKLFPAITTEPNPANPYTLVFDATGNPKSMNGAFAYCAPTARLTFVGLHRGEVTFSDPDFHRRELTLLASRNSTPRDFRDIISFMEQGKIDTTAWITHRVPAADLCGRFQSLLDPSANVLKAIVEF